MAATINVDDDGVECPTATETTIQDGVDTAAGMAGVDTVRVCPGTYDESVTISTKEIVRASSQHPDTNRCDGIDTTFSNRTYVTGDDGNSDNVSDAGPDSGPAFNILADGVQLLNFVIQDVEGHMGVRTDPGKSGYLIQGNLFQNSEGGLYLHSSGSTQTNVKKNCFQENNLNVGSGYATNGIASDQGISKALIQGNLFFKNVDVATDDGAAIALFNTASDPTSITVKGNISREDNEFGFFQSLMSSTVQGNIVQDANIRGLLFEQDTTSVLVKGNIIQRVEDGPGMRFRPDSAGPGTGLTVSNNIIQGPFGGGTDTKGIWIEDDALVSSTFKSNIIQGANEEGIFVGASTATTNTTLKFQRNIVQNSGWDGIFVDSTANGNTIEKNIFQGSNRLGSATVGDSMHFHDCHDNDGTGNTWTKNIGRTQNFTSLCMFATVEAPTTHP